MCDGYNTQSALQAVNAKCVWSRVVNNHSKPPAIFVMGPTASGKTDLAIDLVAELPCEIVSVDSALVYRELDIGTAKPDADVLARAPHRLINIRDPDQAYSAACFRTDALMAMREISAAGSIPLLVGGTMMYFRALEYGLSELPRANPTIRARLEAQASAIGWPAMHRRLAAVDPDAAARIHPNDPQRIQRALEVYAVSGVPLSSLQVREKRSILPYAVVKLGRMPEKRSTLHARIEQRFLRMLKQGFEEEVCALLERYQLSLKHPSMRAVGYRQIYEYLDDAYSRNQMIERGITATRQLAKRQLTWLRADKDIHWLTDENKHLPREALKIVRKTLNFY